MVELLLSEIRGQPGALPLLQFALRELWDRREANRLTVRAYREIGGLAGAIQKTADAVYASFTDEQKRQCRQVFLRLIEPGDGAEDTCRRVRLNEILPADPAQRETVRAVIDRLAAREARLITERAEPPGSEPTIEVAHEALIRGWPLLLESFEADRAGLRAHRQLTAAAHVWDDFRRDDSDLYQGRNLQLALKLRDDRRHDLNALEIEFIEASYQKVLARSKCVGVLEVDKKILTLASAGAEPVLIRRAGGGTEEVGSNLGGPPLGLVEHEDYQQTEIAIDGGDVVVMYTDGLHETANTEGQLFGRERLVRCITAENGGRQAVGRAILGDLFAFSNTALQIDEITMICFGPLL